MQARRRRRLLVLAGVSGVLLVLLVAWPGDDRVPTHGIDPELALRMAREDKARAEAVASRVSVVRLLVLGAGVLVPLLVAWRLCRIATEEPIGAEEMLVALSEYRLLPLEASRPELAPGISRTLAPGRDAGGTPEQERP